MPGLVGAVSLNDDKVDPGLMPAMRDAIVHRDWYQVDDYVNARGTVAISRVNLGIINVDKQPYSARDGQVKVFLHGEICNDQVAHSSPLEFISRLYEKKGMDFASFLNGSFVIVIVDEDADAVLVAVDRIAYQPLFCFTDGRAFYFGPEMKSLLVVPSLERQLNLAAVADFLTNGHFTRDHTWIEGLERVDRATVLKLTRGGIVRHKYWEDEFQIGQDRGFESYRETLAGLVGQAVPRYLQTDSTYGILLSGGLDSRGVLGGYLEQRPDRELHTISWGREEDIPHSDCAIAKRLAQRVGAHHRFYELTAKEIFDSFRDFILLGEGLTDFPESYDVFHRIREQQGVDIVLRGDHCFAGAKWLKVHDEHTMFLSLNLKALENIQRYREVIKPSYYQLFCERDAETIRHVSSRCSDRNIYNRGNYYYTDIRTRFYLGPLNYVKTFAVESLSPLLDYDLLDFWRTVPARHRLDKGLWQKTVVETYSGLSEEVATKHNMIDWVSSFQGSAELERFIYRELIEKPGILSEFVDLGRLKSELDIFFATSSTLSGFSTKARTSALGRLKTLPTAYHFAHKYSYRARKWMGRFRNYLPPEWLIIRLLVLKGWGDVFLSYPVARTPV